MCRQSASAGFTLIEALAALMLVAIVLPVVMHGLSAATQVGSFSRNQDLATAMAEAKLAELVAGDDWQSAPRQGSFDREQWGAHADRFTWQLETADWDNPSTRQLTIEVFWAQRGRSESVRLTTLAIADEGS
ncbi:MAG: prepilin-type N-terminal cleavage/methylation domain-containing protein [Phycisphaeraceae bacterium]